jgi:hypothetical protein
VEICDDDLQKGSLRMNRVILSLSLFALTLSLSLDVAAAPAKKAASKKSPATTITDTCQKAVIAAAKAVANKQLTSTKYSKLGPGDAFSYQEHGVFKVVLQTEDDDDVETFSVQTNLTPVTVQGVKAFNCSVKSARFVSGGGEVAIAH